MTTHTTVHLTPEATVRVDAVNGIPTLTIELDTNVHDYVTLIPHNVYGAMARITAARFYDQLGSAVLAARNMLGEVPGLDIAIPEDDDDDELGGEAVDLSRVADAAVLVAGGATPGEAVEWSGELAQARTLVRGEDGTAVELADGDAWPPESVLAARYAFAQAHPMTETEHAGQWGDR